MKRNTKIIASSMILTTAIMIASCVASSKVKDKSGMQLWSENCQRCHNTPPSSAFTNTQWEVINTHMRERAMLTKEEYKKITEFMQAGQ